MPYGHGPSEEEIMLGFSDGPWGIVINPRIKKIGFTLLI